MLLNIFERSFLMLENIEKQDNKILLISEKEQQVFLPYTLKELEDYLDQFPDAYSSTDDVIKKEFVLFPFTKSILK